jgi:phosphatidylglycerophosphate synthase
VEEPADPAPRRLLGREEYLAAWSSWHGGTDPCASRLVRGWLSMAYALARPVAWVPPLVATAAGLLVAAAAAGAAAAGGWWLVGAGALVGLSGLLDSLDGVLAIGTGRASRRGFVVDSAADRLTEAGYAAGLWLAGAPGPLAVALGALCWLPEYLRARAGQAGIAETGRLSVWERPTRVALAGFTLGGAGLVSPVLPVGAVVTAGTAAGCVLGLMGVTQLSVSLRRALGE